MGCRHKTAQQVRECAKRNAFGFGLGRTHPAEFLNRISYVPKADADECPLPPVFEDVWYPVVVGWRLGLGKGGLGILRGDEDAGVLKLVKGNGRAFSIAHNEPRAA
jgi:hypothetical protein